jgi:hypothetical protein
VQNAREQPIAEEPGTQQQPAPKQGSAPTQVKALHFGDPAAPPPSGGASKAQGKKPKGLLRGSKQGGAPSAGASEAPPAGGAGPSADADSVMDSARSGLAGLGVGPEASTSGVNDLEHYEDDLMHVTELVRCPEMP